MFISPLAVLALLLPALASAASDRVPRHQRSVPRRLSHSQRRIQYPSSRQPSLTTSNSSALAAALGPSINLSNGFDGACFVTSRNSSLSAGQSGLSNGTLAIWDGRAWVNSSQTLNATQLFNATELFNASALIPLLSDSTWSMLCSVTRSNSTNGTTQVFFDPLPSLPANASTSASSSLTSPSILSMFSTIRRPATTTISASTATASASSSSSISPSPSSSDSSASISASSSQSPSSASVAPSTSSAQPSSSAASPPPASSSSSAAAASTTPAVPSGDRQVWSHHMVGNTFSYTAAMWLADVQLAAKSGIDGFVLNMGSDSWQPAQVASAYAAAQSFGSSFKMLLSFDVTSLPCSSSSAAATLVDLAAKYAAHPNQATYKATGRPILSTFAGSTCTFGLGSGTWADKWKSAVLDPVRERTGKQIFFMPAAFVDLGSMASLDAMDGIVNWNGAWPMSDKEIDSSSDSSYLSALGSSKAYTATVSPLFYTHYGKSTWDKNWLYLSDGFLFAKRWELLVESRSKYDFVEQLTWNDFGESSYLGPIQGDQPNSQAWVDGHDHTPLLAVNAFYSEAFKTGAYPAVKEDVIYLSARPHPAAAVATADDVGRPTGGQNGPADGYLWPKDNFYALVFAKDKGTVKMTSGSTTNTFSVNAGVNFLESPLSAGAGMSATLSRDSQTVASVSPSDFVFTAKPKTLVYNYSFFSSSPQ